MWEVCQDAGGARALTWSAAYRLAVRDRLPTYRVWEDARGVPTPTPRSLSQTFGPRLRRRS
ncbi:hypothetical protein GCM10018785_51110 [Streptomyces longispororuber]|uniref:Uncharacterized protein n=1 Tax=Streptomyces longispororuber TaxID=68230 RepID=A0A919DSR7_9ACTN|nr:hypothetical protein GCM10018785_51110 [Streptomyces longispororuber]